MKYFGRVRHQHCERFKHIVGIIKKVFGVIFQLSIMVIVKLQAKVNT